MNNQIIHVDKNSRCAPYYYFGDDIPFMKVWETIADHFGQPLDVTDKVAPNYQKQFQPTLFIGLMTFQTLLSLVIIGFLLNNSYQFGYKQKRFRQSPVLSMFYLFATLNMLVYVCVGVISIM